MKKFKLLSVLGLSAALVVGLFTGCGNKVDTSNTKQLNVYNCGDYIDPELVTKLEKQAEIKAKLKALRMEQKRDSKGRKKKSKKKKRR